MSNSSSITNTTLRNENLHRGWVAEPATRGTWGIILPSTVSILLSTWTMLCLNIPCRQEPAWKCVRRKMLWMLIGIAGPEFVLTYAVGQWGRARDSVEKFKKSSYPQWTNRHGFFADMGGFYLMQSREYGTFPLTGAHIHYLVTRGYMNFPTITQDEIKDKSKQDTIAKTINCIQIGYLVLQCIARRSQHLTVTTLELSTLAIVTFSLITSFFWLKKPSDVNVPIELKLREGVSIDQIIHNAGKNAQQWQQTPIDFVDDLCPSWDLNVMAFMNLQQQAQKPVSSFGNDRFPNLRGYEEAILCCTTLCYPAIHLLAWPNNFPTTSEKVLWKTSSLVLLIITFLFWVCETPSACYRRGRLRWLFCCRPRSIATQPSRTLPLKWEFWSIFPLACLYFAARTYLVFEAFFGLRALDPSAYQTINWVTYFPHV